MHTDPNAVMTALGTIEDQLEERQLEHARLAGAVKRAEKFMEVYEATLYDAVEAEEYANPTERKVIAKSMLHDTDEWTQYLDDLDKLEQLRKTFDYLDVRRSIGQSILKAQEPTKFPQHGQSVQPQ
jgi:hypothetical protein